MITPRALMGLGFAATGMLFAFLALFAFPRQARADILTCSGPEFTEEAGNEYGELYVTMTSDAGCTIYYTVGAWNWPANPTHSSAIYVSRLGIPHGQYRYYKALAYKANAQPTEDSGVSWYEVDNSGN
jgi:hypothetical protein